jgi:predicted Fe-S protein YdhL (DUF1289 family)
MIVNSPCINICELQNDYCVGCKRTIDEIINWQILSDEEKAEIITQIQQRGYDVSKYESK